MVPTGFGPVFEFDDDFTICYRWFRHVFPGLERFFIF